MTGCQTRSIVIIGLALVVSTPSDARQEVSNPQQVSDVFDRAWQGDADAQVTLGGWYFSGQGFPKDADEAVRLWRLAAEQGHLPAQTGLGGRYFNGRGVEQDEAEAFRWYRMAAEQGDPEPVAWLHLTAEQGSIEAQVNLTEMYSVMIGRAANVAEAVRWYRLAAEQG